jgi:D-alanyl-D-alanine carboxypeptidase
MGLRRLLVSCVVNTTLVAALACAVFVFPLQAARQRPARRSVEVSLPAVDALANAALSAGVPGLTIGIRRGNELLFERGYGWSDRENQLGATALSIYQIGSITKQFTAAAILRLSEQGRLTLQDAVGQYVPELETRGQTITLAQLLNHTSGLPNYTEFLSDAYKPMTAQEMIDLINSRPFTFAPGTAWAYSNSGYYVLGMVIERVSGESFARYLDLNFFKPLGLTRTSYCGTDPALPIPDGYLRLQQGSPFRVPAADMSLPYAAGALCSTAGDLLRWNVALSSGLAISRSSYQQMITPTVVASGYAENYGYGLAVGRHLGRDLIYHGGGILGFQTFLAYYPGEDLTITVLTNLLDVNADHSGVVALEVARVLLSE